MRVAELTGALLDYWVARATGKGCWDWSDGTKVTFADWQKHPSLHGRFTQYSVGAFRPSELWEHGGPIIDQNGIYFEPSNYERDGKVFAYVDVDRFIVAEAYGETRLISAMRAYVASKFGDTVPDESAAIAATTAKESSDKAGAERGET